MPNHASGSFEIASWDEQPLPDVEDAPKMTRASVTQTLKGDFEGRSHVEYLMIYEEGGAATFVSLERVVGRLGGRSGSFVLRGSGTYADGTARGDWQVVDGSGTGKLRDLRGSGSFVATSDSPASFTLDYELSEASGA